MYTKNTLNFLEQNDLKWMPMSHLHRTLLKGESYSLMKFVAAWKINYFFFNSLKLEISRKVWLIFKLGNDDLYSCYLGKVFNNILHKHKYWFLACSQQAGMF